MSSLITAIQVAKRDIGIEEDDYRSLLERVTGKASLRLMTSVEHENVLDELAAKGAGTSKKKLDGPYGVKLQALWLSGWNLGLMRSSTTDALLAFVKGQTNIDHTRFLRDAKDARKAVEALKKWLERGGVDWSVDVDPKECVLQAQFEKLGGSAKLTDIPAVRSWLQGRLDDKEKVSLMQRLGTRIRAKAP